MLDGTNYIIFIDTVTPRSEGKGLQYRPVVCGTSNNFAIEGEGVGYRNKQDEGWDQSYTGYNSWSLDMDGQAIGLSNDDQLIKANFHEVAMLAYDKKEFWIMQSDPMNESIVREGWCRIGSYRETASMSSPYTFTTSFVGIGKPILASVFLPDGSTDFVYLVDHLDRFYLTQDNKFITV